MKHIIIDLQRQPGWTGRCSWSADNQVGSRCSIPGSSANHNRKEPVMNLSIPLDLTDDLVDQWASWADSPGAVMAWTIYPAEVQFETWLLTEDSDRAFIRYIETTALVSAS